MEPGLGRIHQRARRDEGVEPVARLVGEGTGAGIEPEVTGGYRLGDVRHVVASPARATAELGFTAAVTFEDGVREFATAPLRA